MSDSFKNIKNKLDQHEFDFRPQSWENMEALLNDRTPKKSYFKTKTILIMTTLFLFLVCLLLQHFASPPLADFNTPQHVALAQDFPSLRDLESPNGTDRLSLLSPNSPFTIQNSPLNNSPFFKKLTEKLTAYNDHYAPEKAYLQFDRTFFEPGESIWFNAFLRNANSLKTSGKSEVLYVELLAPNGSVAQKLTLRTKNGRTAGDFQLPTTATGGLYKIKAYTNWQLNTDEAFVRDIQVQASVLPRLRMEMDFQRKAYGPGDQAEAKIELKTLANEPLSNFAFTAKASLDGEQFQEIKGQTDIGGRAVVKIDLPKKLETNDGLLNVLINYNGQTESVSRSIPIVLNKIDLQFMPEGGDLVACIESKVAFKAINEFGKPADVEGVIKNNQGQIITTFRSYHQGMGVFNLMPKNGEQYVAYLTKPIGISEKYILPETQARGYAISVNNSDKKELMVEINSTENEELNIVLISSGEIYFTQTIPADAGAHLIKIPTETLPIGIAQVTLFDSKEIPRAERLVFLNPHKKLNVEIKTNKEKYLPREKVEMTVKVTDERGLPMPGQFALSVADDNLLTFADDKQGNILSYLLLESELIGKVVEPNFYFAAKGKYPGKDQLLALDYLMLTQGWRRFDWKEVLWEQPVAMEYERERVVTKGMIVDKNGSPVPRILVNLINTELSALTDEKGEFEFDTIFPAGQLLEVKHHSWEGRQFLADGTSGKLKIQLPFVVEQYADLDETPISLEKIQLNGVTSLQGVLKDANTGEPLIFGTVALYKNGVLVTGTETDFDGFFSITQLDAGLYDVVFSYTGYQDQRITGVIANSGKSNTLHAALSPGVELSAVVVAYERPLVSKDETTQGKVFSSDDIKNLPTRNVNALANLGAGATSADDGDEINIRGSRVEGTNFYVDGIRIGPQSDMADFGQLSTPANATAIGFGNLDGILPTRQKKDESTLETVTFEDQSIDEAVEIERPRAAAPPPPPPPPPANVAEIFKVVEEQPIFLTTECQGLVSKEERKKCSDEKLKAFLYQNLRYPAIAKESTIEGMVVVSFVVEPNGQISNAQVVRDIGGGAGNEALKVVQQTNGLWQPGRQRGRNVRMRYNLPIRFKLDADVSKERVTPLPYSQVRRNEVAEANLMRLFYTPRQFYSPKYESAASTANVPRTDFRKTVFWKPDLTVDRNGIARIEFYNSDAITTFRTTVEGLGMDGSIGHGEQRFFTQMPFGMDVKIPTSLLVGDHLVLPLTLMNHADKTISGKLDINTPPHFSLVKPMAETIELKAGETKTIYPEYLIGFEAKTGDLQVAFLAEGLQDAFVETIDVSPRGFPVHQVFGGNQPTQVFDFVINDPVEGSLEATFTIHPSVLSELTSGLEKMIRQPGGCFEQTSSSNYPNVLVLNFLQKTGNSAPDLVKRANDHLDFGYKRLKTFEVKDGGFDWYGKPPAHEALTAYGLMEFVDMKAVYPVEQDLIERTAKWLLTRRDGQGGWDNGRPGLHSWKQKSPIADAYITWAMTEAGYGKQLSAEVTKTVKDANTTQDPYIMALAANILINLRDDRAAGMLAALANLQKADGSWDGLSHSMTHSTGKNLTVETTGLATLAFLKAPNLQLAEDGQWSSAKTINAAVDYLATAKTHHGFGSTQATILALKALTKHAENTLSKMGGGPVAVFVNGKKAAEQTITADQKEPIIFTGLADHFQNGKNKVEVRFSDSKKALPYDLSIDYHTRQPQSDTDCLLDLKTELITNNKSPIKMGETVRLTTTLKNKSAEVVPNPIAIVGIPAGLGIQPWQVKEMQEKNLFDFYEIKNGYVVFYFREMDGGETKNIHLDLKAEIPGEFEAPASSAYLYYTNDAVVWDKPETVSVGY